MKSVIKFVLIVKLSLFLGIGSASSEPDDGRFRSVYTECLEREFLQRWNALSCEKIVKKVTEVSLEAKTACKSALDSETSEILNGESSAAFREEIMDLLEETASSKIVRLTSTLIQSCNLKGEIAMDRSTKTLSFFERP